MGTDNSPKAWPTGKVAPGVHTRIPGATWPHTKAKRRWVGLGLLACCRRDRRAARGGLRVTAGALVTGRGKQKRELRESHVRGFSPMLLEEGGGGQEMRGPRETEPTLGFSESSRGCRGKGGNRKPEPPQGDSSPRGVCRHGCACTGRGLHGRLHTERLPASGGTLERCACFRTPSLVFFI